MATEYIIPHHPYIPDSVVLGTKFDDSDIEIHLTGKLADLVRLEAKEMGKTDVEVVYQRLLEFLNDNGLPKVLPANYLPIRFRVDGKLADALRKNAGRRGISPEESALEILAMAYDVPCPTIRPAGKKKRIAKGLSITIVIPGLMAQAMRMRNYPNNLTSEQVVATLLWVFRDPEDFPPIPGMEECL
jgi:hypothetical protein